MKIPVRPPTLPEILRDFSAPGMGNRLTAILGEGISPAPRGKYRHWDILRRTKLSGEFTPEELWAGIKIARAQLMRSLPLCDENGGSFRYAMPDLVLEALHEIDQDASGQIAAPDAITNPQTRDRYLQSSLIEEAITSSQLEGASSTREQAKAMIRSGREPIDTSERMILNNYRAIQLIGRFKGVSLSRKVILQIHRSITEGMIDEGGDSNHIRQPGDEINVYDRRDGTLLHVPPPAEQLAHRMELMCEFANGAEQGGFFHPVLRAIILHFWLAYDHPFKDGNGRTARALFYWSMLSQGYWLCEYISISRIIRNAPAKYARSFLYTETDENDLTYFVLAQLEVIRRAIKELQTYLRQKTEEIRYTERMLRASVEINHRQLALLGHALRHPGFRYTIESHKGSHRVTYQTARTDLLDLAEKGMLAKTKSGRIFVFAPSPNLPEKLQELS